MFKALGAASRLKRCSPFAKKWLKDKTLKLAESEYHAQEEAHRAGDPDARDRMEILGAAIDLINTLDT